MSAILKIRGNFFNEKVSEKGYLLILENDHTSKPALIEESVPPPSPRGGGGGETVHRDCGFSTGLVRLYIAGLPLRSCLDHWATFCRGVPNV